MIPAENWRNILWCGDAEIKILMFFSGLECSQFEHILSQSKCVVIILVQEYITDEPEKLDTPPRCYSVYLILVLDFVRRSKV